MRCVACIPLAVRRDDPFWLSEDAFNYILDIVRPMAEWPFIERLLLPSDSPELAHKLRKQGFQALDMPPEPDHSPRLVPGARQALRLLVDAGETLPVLLRDLRYPAVGPCETGQILDIWQPNPNTIVCSVHPPRDHPCQFYQGYRLNGAGFIHNLDLGFTASPEGFLASRPCLLPMGELPAADGSQTFWDTSLLQGAPARQCSPIEAAAAGRILLSPEPDGRCRLYFPRRSYPTDVRAVSLLAVDAPSAVLVEESGRLELRFQDHGASTSLSGSDTVVITALCGSEELSQPLSAGERIFFHFEPDGPGFYYFFCSQLKEGVADLLLHYQDGAHRWKIRNDVLTSTDSGREIWGRQGFPDIHRIDGAVALGTLDALLRFAEVGDRPAFIPFPTPAPELKVTCLLEYLRYQTHKTMLHREPSLQP